MPDFNETTVAQSFVDSSPRSKDRNRELYPCTTREEIYVQRRRSPRDIHSLSPRPAIVYAPSVPGTHSRSDSSASPVKHQVRFDDEASPVQHDRVYSDEDSLKRCIIRRHRPDRRDLNLIPVNDGHDDYSHRAGLGRSDACDYDSESDSDTSSSSDEDRRKQEKIRKKKLLYMGLACITTIAAGNNVYQSTKAHHARHRFAEEGEMSQAEAIKLRKKALMLDVLSVGVVAVGLNNVRMGWKRVESIGQA